MLDKAYTRSELGIKRGNILWKIKKEDNTVLFFINEGKNQKGVSEIEYRNTLDKENDILYICIGESIEWLNNYMEDLKNFELVRFFYRENREPVWYEYKYDKDSIGIDKNCIKIVGYK